MWYALALASAAFYGAGDFIGGIAARQTNTLATVVISQLAGLVILGALLPALPHASPSSPDLLWGAAAGIAGGSGVALLYHALAIGTMAIVAPVTAVCAVLIPVLFDVLGGHPLAVRTGAGIMLALVAIVLVSQSGSEAANRRRDGARSPGLALALAAGVAIGLFFLALARTSPAAGMWPLASARGVSVALFAALALHQRTPFAMPLRIGILTIAGGVLDMVANALYLLATRGGALSVVVTLASLYPASTVILARVFLRERLTVLQHVGIVTALAAVVLIVSAG